MNSLKANANESVGGSPTAAPARRDSTVNEMCLSNYNIYPLRGNLGMAAPMRKAVKPTEETR
jgi:hypothetical protein